jgi:uncharacterized lipoprotein YbaY
MTEKKIQGRTRPVQFNMHFTPKEFQQVKRYAVRLELSVSEFIRQAIIGEGNSNPTLRKTSKRKKLTPQPVNDLGGAT